MPRSKDNTIICRPEFPPRSCPAIFPPKPLKPPKTFKTKKVVTDEICGNIEQNITLEQYSFYIHH
jgi:hypothetical protein